MSVSTIDAGVIRIGNGATVEFSFDFRARTAADIKVANIVNGALVVVDPSNYIVLLDGDLTGGTVTFFVAPANTLNFYIYRETPLTQEVAVSSQQRYDPQVAEDVWDKLTMIAQELSAKVALSIQGAPGSDLATLVNDLLVARNEAVAAATAVLVQEITGKLTIANGGNTAMISFGAADRAIMLFNGANLQLASSGGVGVRILTDDFQLLNSAGVEKMIEGDADGSVFLFHNGVEQLKTISDGIELPNAVTGNNIAVPAAPAANKLKSFTANRLLRPAPAYIEPNGMVRRPQPDLMDFGNQVVFQPVRGLSTLPTTIGMPLTAVGTLSAATFQTPDLFRAMPRINVTAASALNANCGFRATDFQFTFNKVAGHSIRGWKTAIRFGVFDGATNLSSQVFAGLVAVTGVAYSTNPSALTSCIGMGWDSADTNIQLMHNDISGACTKIDLGANFPVPAANEERVYEIQLSCEDTAAMDYDYRVIRYNIDNLIVDFEATGSITTNVVGVANALPVCYMNTGTGVTAAVGLSLYGMGVEVDF